MLAVCLWKESHSIKEWICLSRKKNRQADRERGPQTLTASSSFLLCVNMIEYASRLHNKPTIRIERICIFSQIWISSLTLVCGAVPRQHWRPVTCNLSGHRNWKTGRTSTAQRACRPPLPFPLKSFIAEQQSSSINSHSCQWA